MRREDTRWKTRIMGGGRIWGGESPFWLLGGFSSLNDLYGAKPESTLAQCLFRRRRRQKSMTRRTAETATTAPTIPPIIGTNDVRDRLVEMESWSEWEQCI